MSLPKVIKIANSESEYYARLISDSLNENGTKAIDVSWKIPKFADKWDEVKGILLSTYNIKDFSNVTQKKVTENITKRTDDELSLTKQLFVKRRELEELKQMKWLEIKAVIQKLEEYNKHRVMEPGKIINIETCKIYKNW